MAFVRASRRVCALLALAASQPCCRALRGRPGRRYQRHPRPGAAGEAAGRVATIVVGNPVIADAAVQSGGWMVITGKGYGMTNIVALDRSGAVLMEKTIEVQGPQNVVVVYRGVERETYSCTPVCERRLTLGDGKPSSRRSPARSPPATRSPQAPSSRANAQAARARLARRKRRPAWLASVDAALAVVGDYHNNSTTPLCYCSTASRARLLQRSGVTRHASAHEDTSSQRRRLLAVSRDAPACRARKTARPRSNSGWSRRRSCCSCSRSWRRRSSSSPARRWKPRSPIPRA